MPYVAFPTSGAANRSSDAGILKCYVERPVYDVGNPMYYVAISKCRAVISGSDAGVSVRHAAPPGCPPAAPNQSGRYSRSIVSERGSFQLQNLSAIRALKAVFISGRMSFLIFVSFAGTTSPLM